MGAVTLEGSECRLEYLNEGGANFVFRILPEGSDGLQLRLQGKLLRLRKQLVDDPDDLIAGEAEWRAIFPSQYLIQHELIALPITFDINSLLRNVEGRPAHRTSDSWQGGAYGVLVTDMTPASGERLVQLKPKWLVQSPSAPVSAKRCRTCALRAQRAAGKGVVTATDQQGSCPLDLVSGSKHDRGLAAERLTDDETVRKYLIEDALPLFRVMQECQQRWDPHGVLSLRSEDDAQTLGKAMTLRDCTLFVLVKSDGEVEARLGDLDMKGRDKLERWRAMERGLVDGGWYMGVDEFCLLSRGVA